MGNRINIKCPVCGNIMFDCWKTKVPTKCSHCGCEIKKPYIIIEDNPYTRIGL
jgi:uncharacterized protein (DUF983 family)